MAEAATKRIKGKSPAAQFYWRDWLTDPALRSVSSGARGLWMDMLCLMWECVPRGYLQTPAGTPYSLEMICRATGNISMDEVVGWLGELKDSGVSSQSASGSLFSRRLVRDEHKRALCRDAGRKGGGNPHLKKKGGEGWARTPGFVYAMSRDTDEAIKIGASVDPASRARKASGSLAHVGARVIKTWEVLEMGIAEKLIHDTFIAKQESGEWFWLTARDLDEIGAILERSNMTLKGGAKRGDKRDAKRTANPSSSPSGEERPPARRFVSPTFEDVAEYCLDRKNSVDPRKWFDHYTSNGWMVGKNKMKDWRAAVRTWEQNDLAHPSAKPQIDLFAGLRAAGEQRGEGYGSQT